MSFNQTKTHNKLYNLLFDVSKYKSNQIVPLEMNSSFEYKVLICNHNLLKIHINHIHDGIFNTPIPLLKDFLNNNLYLNIDSVRYNENYYDKIWKETLKFSFTIEFNKVKNLKIFS